MTEIDWDALRAVALDAMTHAYVPYSRFPVGVAGCTSKMMLILSNEDAAELLTMRDCIEALARAYGELAIP